MFNNLAALSDRLDTEKRVSNNYYLSKMFWSLDEVVTRLGGTTEEGAERRGGGRGLMCVVTVKLPGLRTGGTGP